MKNKRTAPPAPVSIRGFNLVELMVAITIGLIIMAAVSTIFVSSRANYSTQESVARLQESARIAISLVSRDLRMAGYYGCLDGTQNMYSVLASTAGVAYNYSVTVEGMEAGTGLLYPSGEAPIFATGGSTVTAKYANCPNAIGGYCTGTDAIALRLSDPSTSVPLTATMPNAAAALTVGAGSGIAQDEIVIVSDCGGADLFQVTAIQNASGALAVQHGAGGTAPGNAAATLNRTYGPPGGQITRFVTRLYYIGTGTSGYPALFRKHMAAPAAEELIEGIQDLQITYGVATNEADRTPRAYFTASGLGTSANWRNVVSANLVLTAVPVNTTNPSAAAGTNTQVEPKQFTSTVFLRNLQ